MLAKVISEFELIIDLRFIENLDPDPRFSEGGSLIQPLIMGGVTKTGNVATLVAYRVTGEQCCSDIRVDLFYPPPSPTPKPQLLFYVSVTRVMTTWVHCGHRGCLHGDHDDQGDI